VDVVIDASSIDTGIPKRDTDLRTAHFLDVERYPVITFQTLYVTARQADAFQIVGELTMKGRWASDTRDRAAASLSMAQDRACRFLLPRQPSTAGLWRQWDVAGDKIRS
jgi:hypothetical protein